MICLSHDFWHKVVPLHFPTQFLLHQSMSMPFFKLSLCRCHQFFLSHLTRSLSLSCRPFSSARSQIKPHNNNHQTCSPPTSTTTTSSKWTCTQRRSAGLRTMGAVAPEASKASNHSKTWRATRPSSKKSSWFALSASGPFATAATLTSMLPSGSAHTTS